MPDCFLTERQKEMLRALLPGLKDGTVKTEWIIFGGSGIVGVDWGSFSASVWRNVWRGVSEDDFNAFVACGLMHETSNGGYRLFRDRMIEFIENGFQQP